MDKKEIKSAYIYTRVSTEEQAQGFSLEAQADDIKKYCELHKIHIAGEYCDAGITGTSIDKRESFKQMLRDIKTHKDNIDAVIIWKLSRISRNMMDLVDIVRYFEEHNIVIISITDRIDTSSVMGKFFFYLVGAFAEMERENIVLQARNGMKKRAEEGKWNGGKPPIGYDYYNDRGLVVNENEAKTVRLIFDLYSNKGWGYSRICQFLNRNLDQYATKNHKSWSYATVKQVLDNPTYAGYIRWGKQQNWSKERRKGTTKEYVLVKGKHEPIISEELWQRAQELRQGKKAPEKLKNMHYLLSGLAKCPQCGASMISQRTQRTRKSDGEKIWYRFYGCSQWANKKAVCKPNLVKADLLEQQVLERIRVFVRHPRLPELLAERLGKSEDIAELEEKLKSLEKRISKLKSDEDKYYDFLIDEEKLKVLKEDKILEKIKQISNEIEQLTEEKEKLAAQIENIRNNTLNIQKIADMLQNFDAVFDSAPFEKQKELLHTLIKEIRIKKSDNIDERLAEEIILHFSELDLMQFGKDTDEQKAFEVNGDTARSLLFYKLYRSAHIRLSTEYQNLAPSLIWI